MPAPNTNPRNSNLAEFFISNFPVATARSTDASMLVIRDGVNNAGHIAVRMRSKDTDLSVRYGSTHLVVSGSLADIETLAQHLRYNPNIMPRLLWNLDPHFRGSEYHDVRNLAQGGVVDLQSSAIPSNSEMDSAMIPRKVPTGTILEGLRKVLPFAPV